MVKVPRNVGVYRTPACFVDFWPSIEGGSIGLRNCHRNNGTTMWGAHQAAQL